MRLDLPGSGTIPSHVMWPQTPVEQWRLAIAAPHMLPSAQTTASASTTSSFRGSIHTPRNHCVRFGPRVAATPATLVTGRLAMPYPDGTFTRWIAPASPGAPSGDPYVG